MLDHHYHRICEKNQAEHRLTLHCQEQIKFTSTTYFHRSDHPAKTNA